MSFTYIRRAAVMLALFAAAGCTVKDTQAPPLSGPSGLALSLNVNAVPDAISQDGGSQSSVRVQVIGPDGRPMAGVALRLDMFVSGVAQDYGTLSARSVVTAGDGVASAVYTAPPNPVNGVFGTCNGLPGNCVSIVATPTSTNFATANPQQVIIRLMPTGVILPPPTTPVAQFTISPTPVNLNVPAIFDASRSCGGPLVNSVCNAASGIVSYAWSFGDGFSDSGPIVTHTYVSGTNSFTVSLTVTNDRGVSSSTTQTVAVSVSTAPTGDWVFSPAAPSVGETVFFNADGVKAAAGRQLVSLTWNFGDGTTSSGAVTSHSFFVGASYAVVFTATDDAGQKTVLPKTIVVGTGNPVATLLVSKTGGVNTIQGDGSGSTSASGTAILNYTFDFGDGTAIASGASPTQLHTYAGTGGTFTVRLTVTDSLGRVGTTTASITVP